jgi:hypothetical protein
MAMNEGCSALAHPGDRVSEREPVARKKHDRKPEPNPSSALDALETVEVKASVFKDTCLELMDDVRDHRKQVVITKYGQAVARLVPPDTGTPSAFGFLRGTLLAQGDIVSPDFEVWGDVG